jgi:hypothetical protein
LSCRNHFGSFGETKLTIRSIYFPTALPLPTAPDKGLTESQQLTLTSLASDFKEYLASKPDAHLELQGHADRRGTPEYNHVLLGAGATNLAPDRSQVNSVTRFAWVFGGGIKYSFSKHLGMRLQAKWSPTYINTVTEGVWCDPFWGGCWAKGDSVFLNELDGTVGLTFRF